jgi:hypothetical protein
MNKNLSIILSTVACAGLIAAAGLSQSSAQQAPQDEPPTGMQKAPHGGQSKGTMPGQQPGDTHMTTERATGTKAADARTLMVTVKDVDRDTHMVTFQAKISPEANIRQNGQPIKLDQLQEGDALRIQFNPKTGEVMRAEVLKKAPQ